MSKAGDTDPYPPFVYSRLVSDVRGSEYATPERPPKPKPTQFESPTGELVDYTDEFEKVTTKIKKTDGTFIDDTNSEIKSVYIVIDCHTGYDSQHYRIENINFELNILQAATCGHSNWGPGGIHELFKVDFDHALKTAKDGKVDLSKVLQDTGVDIKSLLIEKWIDKKNLTPTFVEQVGWKRFEKIIDCEDFIIEIDQKFNKIKAIGGTEFGPGKKFNEEDNLFDIIAEAKGTENIYFSDLIKYLEKLKIKSAMIINTGCLNISEKRLASLGIPKDVNSKFLQDIFISRRISFSPTKEIKEMFHDRVDPSVERKQMAKEDRLSSKMEKVRREKERLRQKIMDRIPEIRLKAARDRTAKRIEEMGFTPSDDTLSERIDEMGITSSDDRLARGDDIRRQFLGNPDLPGKVSSFGGLNRNKRYSRKKNRKLNKSRKRLTRYK
jgi:hypothetical protein